MNGFEEGVEFLPVNNAKQVEKRGPRRWVVMVAVVFSFLLLSLMAGLLVWHFHCEYRGIGGRCSGGSPSSLSGRAKGQPMKERRGSGMRGDGRRGICGKGPVHCLPPGAISDHGGE